MTSGVYIRTDLHKQHMSEAQLGEKNYMYGKHHTEEAKQKNRESNLGKTRSEKTKQKISEAALGRIPTEAMIEGYKKQSIKITEIMNRPETKSKQSKYMKKAHNEKKYENSYKSIERNQKISEARIKYYKEHPGCVAGENNPNYGKGLLGAKNGMWKDGISFEPYSFEFNDILKQQIRERDEFTCQLCWEEENGKKLSIHHIDYNKMNCNPNNLITLCRGCNSKVNANRPEWSNFFSVNLAQRGLL